MEKKIRIQLFDKEGRLFNDRLVTQDTEFTAGPKVKWEGPIRVEFTLENKEDVEKSKLYLAQLSGILPLPEPRGRKPKLDEMDDDDSRQELLSDAIEQAKDQDALITYFREHGFVFMTYDFLKTFEFKTTFKKKHREEYQWMIRRLKTAKNPKADRYDPMLLIGIKLIGERNDKVVIYLNSEYHSKKLIKIPVKPKETYKKSGMMKFNRAMTERERDKFRFEIRQYQADINKPLSKFYRRWEEFVENAPKLENPKE